MATEVKVNLDMLEDVWKIYNDEITSLKEAVKKLDEVIETLRSSAWKTNGADEFFKNYDKEWKRNFEEHISYLEHLRDCLSKARDEFGSAYQKNRTLY